MCVLYYKLPILTIMTHDYRFFFSLLFNLQRNRLLVIPWIINSFISLVFNGMGIVLTVIISMKSNAPDYSSIIPFTVAAVIVFGNYIRLFW